MRALIYILISFHLLSCKNHAQSLFDKIPLDTIKWSATDTLFSDFNNDGIDDAVLEFDKYRFITRPDNIQTPIIFYLGSNSKTFTFFKKSEKLIGSPYYEIKILNSIIMIIQKGIGDDPNVYTNFYRYQNGEILMFKELVERRIEKLKVDNETGDVITILDRVDTLYVKEREVPIEQYDFSALKMNRWNK